MTGEQGWKELQRRQLAKERWIRLILGTYLIFVALSLAWMLQ